MFDAIYQRMVDAAGVSRRLPEDLRLIETLGRPSPDERVLDAGCGEGRIVRGLIARGVPCEGADASAWMVEEARRRSRRAGVPADFRWDDFLAPRRRARYDMILSWDTSFGFHDESRNRRVLRTFRDVLQPGGRLVMNVADYETVAAQMPRVEEAWIDGRRVVHHHWIEHARRRLETRREVDGREDARVSTRLHTADELADHLRAAGFARVAFADVERPALPRQHYVLARP